jgi:uncharacterized protein with NRDE domain
MCLLVAAWRMHPRLRLAVAANRDEFHARPAAPLSFWTESPNILAGRDLQAGGTWLGLDRARRFGVITNYREMARPRRNAPSRGRLIVDYLAGTASAWEFANSIESDALGYAGFSLLLADENDLVYACNRADVFAQRLPPGVYGLSNHLLDTPWPKLVRVRDAMSQWLSNGAQDAAPLWRALGDRQPAEDNDMTRELTVGLDPKWSRVVSSPFVVHDEYGTRSSTLSLITDSGQLEVHERLFQAMGRESGQARFELRANDWDSPATT